MDKTWIKAPIRSKTYKDGAKVFIEFACKEGEIRCPCMKCCLQKWLDCDSVHGHILVHGFLPGYTTRMFHGEMMASSQYDTPYMRKLESRSQSTSVQKAPLDTGNILNLHEDVMGPKYEDREVGQTEGFDHHEGANPLPDKEAAQFQKLLEEYNQEFYEGSSYCRNDKYKIVKLYKDAEASLKKKLEQDLHGAGYTKKQVEEALKTHQFGTEELEREFDSLPPLRGFAAHQWLKLLDHIESPDFKRSYYTGKTALQKHNHVHTTGTTSFAQKKVEYIKNKKRKPEYSELFDFTHKKNETYANDKSDLFMEFAKKKMGYKASGEFPNEYGIQREAWDFFMGEDAPGRARSLGVGVTKTQVRGLRAELMEMRNEGVSFDYSKSTKTQLRKEFAAHKANTAAVIKAMQSELQLYRAAYINKVDPMSQAYGQTHGGSALHKQQVTNQGQNIGENGSMWLKKN